MLSPRLKAELAAYFLGFTTVAMLLYTLLTGINIVRYHVYAYISRTEKGDANFSLN